ncbi:hypothetical protein H6P81_004231 [Aristolochia fimbriata]|uniref:Uncharacterized protein n=1 Tax=Aristolochia fimbriata TaxID=158543 RepID=A0AAV7FHV7_ARIFI|nr:hypothetical protein H6P81_004231 [Aristolochia fimbriata]
MASVLSFTPSLLRPPPSSAAGHRKSDRSDSHRLRASSSNWWTPIFGWTSDPDYVHDRNDTDALSAAFEKQHGGELHKDAAAAQQRPRYAPGCFTQDKARQLRLKTVESETFHDVMYHSAIASRLASDLSDRFAHKLKTTLAFTWCMLYVSLNYTSYDKDPGPSFLSLLRLTRLLSGQGFKLKPLSTYKIGHKELSTKH